ncbi:MAG TPA: hypothetical protein VN775_01865 [Opitutaceae bacterium]|nr:hypothetical protein [Opitutaceae bacterium]
MPDDETPPIRRLVLKPKEITPTETAARPGDGTAISVPLMIKQNEIAAGRSSLRKWDDPAGSPPDGPEAPVGSPLLAPKQVATTDPRSCPGDGTAISARLILHGNLIAAAKAGPEVIALPRKRMSRRTRDFVLLVATASLLVTALMLQLPRTLGTLIMGAVIVAYAAVLLAWIMFGVMDDY